MRENRGTEGPMLGYEAPAIEHRESMLALMRDGSISDKQTEDFSSV